MRKKTVQVLLGAALIAAMCLGAPTAAFAGEPQNIIRALCGEKVGTIVGE